jgi:oligopeptide/dipeptide ABC transporter ATP-binding protein
MVVDKEALLSVIPGRPPSPAEFPPGCAFADRCSFAGDRCRLEDPASAVMSATHKVACWYPRGDR